MYGVITGLRTFPIVKKPLVATVGSGGGKTLLGGGPVEDEGNVGLWAPAVPKRANKEHSTEEEDARNIEGERRRS